MTIFSFIGNFLSEYFGKTDNWRATNTYKNEFEFYKSNDAYLKNNVLRRKNIRCWTLRKSLRASFTTKMFFINLFTYKNISIKLKKKHGFFIWLVSEKTFVLHNFQTPKNCILEASKYVYILREKDFVPEM